MSEMTYYDLKQVSNLAPSLSIQVTREIGKRIVSAAYKPGELIEEEAALAERYRVSRSVIRDAVKILVGKGLLEVRRGIGTRVQPREKWGLLDDDILAWYQLLAPDADIIRQLTDFRDIFEPKAARLAAERGDDASHEKIRLTVERMGEDMSSAEDFVLADAMFHRAILRATQNEFLMALEGVVFSTLLCSTRLTNKDPEDNESSLLIHWRVYDAISQRDGTQAESAMQDLLDDASRRLERRILNS